MTGCGGGRELDLLLLVAFVWFERSRFLYFCCVRTLDGLIVNFFKLSYAEPRPYMIESSIEPIDCSTAFGNPSGHSFASNVFATTVFLEIFHS